MRSILLILLIAAIIGCDNGTSVNETKIVHDTVYVNDEITIGIEKYNYTVTVSDSVYFRRIVTISGEIQKHRSNKVQHHENGKLVLSQEYYSDGSYESISYQNNNKTIIRMERIQ